MPMQMKLSIMKKSRIYLHQSRYQTEKHGYNSTQLFLKTYYFRVTKNLFSADRLRTNQIEFTLLKYVKTNIE